MSVNCLPAEESDQISSFTCRAERSGSVGRALDQGVAGLSLTACVVTVVSFSKTLSLLLSTGSTQGDPSLHD